MGRGGEETGRAMRGYRKEETRGKDTRGVRREDGSGEKRKRKG